MELWAAAVTGSKMWCRLGSSVNADEPVVLKTIIRINCRYERVDESPIYTTLID